MLHIDYAWLTHPGRRKMNQDNIVCMKRYLPRIHNGPDEPVTGSTDAGNGAVFGVFDGMGGEEHGEAASWIAAKTAASMAIRNADDLKVFCKKANRKICQYVRDNAIVSSGTTAALLLFDRNGAHSCHIGDSRIYRCDYGIPEQLTKDDVPPGPGRDHMLLQCLGIPEEEMRITPHLDYYMIRERAYFMICTDGLTHMLTENQIAEVLSDGNSLQQQTRRLTDKALAAGGRDNITLFLIRATP